MGRKGKKNREERRLRRKLQNDMDFRTDLRCEFCHQKTLSSHLDVRAKYWCRNCLKYVQAEGTTPAFGATFFSTPKKEKSSVFGTVICSFCNNPTTYTSTGYWCGPCGRYAYGSTFAEDTKVCRKCHRQMIRYHNTGGWWCTVCRISEGDIKKAERCGFCENKLETSHGGRWCKTCKRSIYDHQLLNSDTKTGEKMGKTKNRWDTATLRNFPDWFQKREDSLELIRKVLVKDEDPKVSDIEKIFDSVFVVCASFNEEDDDYKEGVKAVAELRGFDTIKELTEDLSKEWGKEDIEFVYNTRKKVYLNVEVQTLVEEREFETKDGEDEEVVETKATATPATPPPAPLGLKQGDIKQEVNESTPGTVGGPRRS